MESEIWKSERGEKREREIDEGSSKALVSFALSKYHYCHHRFIVATATTERAEVFEVPCLCVHCISVDYVKSRLWLSNECNYTEISSVLIEKEASTIVDLLGSRSVCSPFHPQPEYKSK